MYCRLVRSGAGNQSPVLCFLAVLIPVFLFSLAGCGGGDQQENARQPGKMVPSSAAEPAPAPADSAAGGAPAAAVPVDQVEGSLSSAGTGTSSPSPPASKALRDKPLPPPQTTGPLSEGNLPPELRRLRPQEKKPATGLGPFVLQVGSFRNRQAAERRLAELDPAKVKAVVVEATVDEVRYWRVYVPNLPTQMEAIRLGDRLRQELGFDSLVRRP